MTAIGIVMDPIEQINYKKDSSLAMLWAAAARGWDLWYLTPSDLFVTEGRAYGRMRPLQVFKDPDHFFDYGAPETLELATLDVILMRRDPPFDNEYVYTTHMLEMAEKLGTLVVNRCQSLRDCNEKMFATQFPECCPDRKSVV